MIMEITSAGSSKELMKRLTEEKRLTAQKWGNPKIVAVCSFRVTYL